MRVLLANPRGFCAGVDRAVDILEKTLARFGAPVYSRHEIVHNRTVVEDLRRRGVVFVDELHEVPPGAVVVFSAHGVSSAVEEEAARRGLKVFDATCPLVTKVHRQVRQLGRAGWECLLIGHAGHPEVEGTMGQYEAARSGAGGIYLVEDLAAARAVRVDDPERLGYVTQTTLSVSETRGILAELRRRFPAIEGPRRDDICYATQNRQDAVRRLAAACDVVLVVGSRNSSNSNRLRELAEAEGARAWLIDSAADLRPEWLVGAETVGITAGASAPEALVQEVAAALGAGAPEELAGDPERIVFPVPVELRESGARGESAGVGR